MIPENMKKVWAESGNLWSGMDNKQMSMSEVASLMSRSTSLDKIKRYYKKFSLLALAMMLCSVGFVNIDIFPYPERIYIAVLLMVYFGICCIMDYWLYITTSSIDLFAMSISEVGAIARKCKKRHHQFMLALAPYALVIFAAFIYLPLKEGNSAWFGAIVGAIVGFCVGLRKYLEVMKNYKKLINEE